MVSTAATDGTGEREYGTPPIRILALPAIAACLCAALANASGEAPSAMTPVDMISLPTLSDPRISPDAKSVVFIKSQPDWDENKSPANLWLSDASSGKTRQLTFSEESKQSPAWSPDGAHVSFLMDASLEGDDEEEYKAIHLLPMSGGQAFPIGEHLSDVVSYEWAPSAKEIYFLAGVPLSEEHRERREAKDDMQPFDEPLSERHLWRVSIEDRVIEQISKAGRYIRSFDLSDDGSLLVYSSADGATRDDMHTADVWIMEIDTGDTRRVTDNQHAEIGIRLSPDNKRILFIADINDEFDYYYDANLFVVPTSGGDPMLIAGEQEFETEDAVWADDAKSVFVRANMGVRSEIWKLSTIGEKPRQITDGKHTIHDWTFDRAADKHVFVEVTPMSPGDVWVMGRNGKHRRAVTGEFSDLQERFQVPRQEIVRWQSADGQSLEGLVSYPLGYSKGARYPLIVSIHGGPRSSIQYGQFKWRSYVPVAAAQGFLVFSPNYRGGRGYGDAFLRDMVGGYFKNAHLDVMSGVDHLVETGLADPDKIVVAGWSAGGHMVNKLITHTDRFRAASSGAGAVDWISMYGESDMRYYRTHWFGGKPWQEGAPISAFVDQSPLKDMWKVTTPTIIFVGEKDVRVPPTQSILLYRALADLGVDVKLYIAPREKHGFSELRHKLFKINAELEWFHRHLGNPGFAWQPSPE